NQLDLNGLVEFNTEAAVRLSLLPSDILINSEEWKIQEEARFDFEDGKTLIRGLDLTQGSQVVSINGAVSNLEEDILTVDFDSFSLRTLNPIARSAGIHLDGLLNGNVEVKSLLKNPFIQSDIKVTDIEFNNILVGDMDLKADLDQTTKLVNLAVEIESGGRRSLSVEGTYNVLSEGNSLNLNMKLDENQLVLFQPFVRKLVSNLSGTATADLNVSGTPFKPIITGQAKFNNAGFIVNYLKTPYLINDVVRVENSTIILDDLVLTDHNNNRANASGTVDMSTPLTPMIHVDINAQNFMVLNTTARD